MVLYAYMKESLPNANNKKESNGPGLRKFVGPLVAAAMVTVGVGIAENATAQAGNVNATSAEQMTQKTGWASEAVAKARHDAKDVVTSQDYHWLKINAVKSFTDHVGPLSNGSEQGAQYSKEDYKKMLEAALQLKALFASLDTKLGVTSNTNIDAVISHLRSLSSIGGYDEYQKVENFH